MNQLFGQFTSAYERERREVLTLESFLARAKTDKGCYATFPERMIKAIGEPEFVDTSKDQRLSRIFQNRTIKVYPAFRDFFGIEDVIERIVGYFVHAAQGLEEKKQVVYLLGPVGSSKSSLAERLKSLAEKEPIYVLADENGNPSPCFESPLGLFDPNGTVSTKDGQQVSFAETFEKEYGISKRYLNGILSPWAIKRLDEYKGDISRFKVVKMNPSKARQIGIAKTEPGDEKNQDISSLVGKVDLRMLDKYSQNDTDAYCYSGALCRGNQGLVEFVEMFKAPIKTLHPLLTATQEGNYVGTQEIGPIPFSGTVLAHSNETEWNTFKNNKNNEAFLDRVYIVKVPYCLRMDEEVKIYRKMLDGSDLCNAKLAPQTLELLAQFFVLTRLRDHENSNLYSKMRVYNGEDLVDSDMQAKTIQEYREAAGVDEGMSGLSTRMAFKILSNTFNYDTSEVAADPVHLFLILQQEITRQQFPKDKDSSYQYFVREYLTKKYAEHIGKVIQTAYLDSYSDFGQNIFDRYVEWADAWMDKKDYKDPDTGTLMNRNMLNEELEKIERPAGISNPKDFRQEIVKFVLKATAANGGNKPDWRSYEKLREVIEKKMFSATTDLLPVISFGSKRSKEDERKHTEFLERMIKMGYSERQTRRLVEWWMRISKQG